MLLKLIMATPAGAGIEIPPIPMIAFESYLVGKFSTLISTSPGKGAVPVEGYVMVGANEMDLPPSVTVIVRVVPENEAVTDCGVPGITPSSSCCRSVLISALRQAQSAVVTTFAPFANVNGSGSAVLL